MRFANLLIALIAQNPQVPDYWGTLRPGPHAVGFSQRWVIDSTRRLPEGAARGPRLRPVLLNLWYPALGASGVRMPYRDYFTGPLTGLPPTSALGRYASALTAYVRELSLRELTRSHPDSLAPPVRARLDAFLDARTGVRRNAPMRRGRLPVVFYLQGARASYDDNVALCEYLASRGHLVVGSAYPREDNTNFSTTVSDESRQRDLRRLLVAVMGLPNVAIGPVIAIGHSAGAQTMLMFATDPSAPIDAVLSLDTTQDYVLLSDRTWANFTDRVVEYRKTVRIPILFAAAPEALFELGDSLTATRRWFVTVPDVRHNDFISQGVIRRELANPDSVETRRARRSYDALVTYVGDWLDAFVAGGDGVDRAAPAAPLQVEFAPNTSSGPVGSPGARSARQLRDVFTTRTEREFVDAFTGARRDSLAAGGDNVLMMLLTGAIAGGRRDVATSTFRDLIARDSTIRRGVLALITDRKELFEGIGAPELARPWANYLTVLDSVAPARRQE